MIKQKSFGKLKDGKEITLFSLSNSRGCQADVMNYGAILVNLFVPDKKGKLADVCLGYDSLSKYLSNGNFFGATVGPIANRTAGASFELEGKRYKLDVNDGMNNLHTHYDKGLHKVYYDATVNEKDNSVTFETKMKDGELGLLGNRTFRITYRMSEDNALELHYEAETDKTTIINLTNHSYFNLDGHDSGSVLNQKLWLNCSKFTQIVAGAIPTGVLTDVAGTPLDFTTPTKIGERIRSRYEQMRLVGGYDHNFVSNGKVGELSKIAVLSSEEAGRTMEVYTDLPGIQFYSANCVNKHLGKGHAEYRRRCAIALETQYFPNCANDPNFARPVVEPGTPYKTTTIYKFV